VSEAAAAAERRAWLQEYDAKKAEREARIAGIERGRAVMAALGEEGLYKLLEMTVPAVVAAAQASDKQSLDRVMSEAVPAVLQALLTDNTPAE
jgi:hypothetical protein